MVDSNGILERGVEEHLQIDGGLLAGLCGYGTQGAHGTLKYEDGLVTFTQRTEGLSSARIARQSSAMKIL